jgi:hypothetical protein
MFCELCPRWPERAPAGEAESLLWSDCVCRWFWSLLCCDEVAESLLFRSDAACCAIAPWPRNIMPARAAVVRSVLVFITGFLSYVSYVSVR